MIDVDVDVVLVSCRSVSQSRPVLSSPACSLGLQKRDAEIDRLTAENKVLAANAMTDDVKGRLNDLEDENARMMQELLRLRATLAQLNEVSLLSLPQWPST